MTRKGLASHGTHREHLDEPHARPTSRSRSTWTAAAQTTVETGVPFFDHMLDAFGRHGLFDLGGQARRATSRSTRTTRSRTSASCWARRSPQALGDKVGITRFGSSALPMDEALVLAAVDISGRGQLHYAVELPIEIIGTFDTTLAKEFLVALATNAGVTLHVRSLAGDNAHHIIEAAFKAVARALKEAVALDPRVSGVPSTKGSAVSPRIAIIDYRMGNLRSVQKGFEHAGVERRRGDRRPGGRRERRRHRAARASARFATPSANLRESGVEDVLRHAIGAGTPFLGICLGMQLLADIGLEDGEWAGLGLVPGTCEQACPAGVKIPHIGWNTVEYPRDSPLFDGIPESTAFYFVHSYRLVPHDSDVVIGSTEYGVRFVAAVQSGNVYAVQFHPEKSSTMGLHAARQLRPTRREEPLDDRLSRDRHPRRAGRAPRAGRLRPRHRLQRGPRRAGARVRRAGAEWIHVVDLDGARDGVPGNIDVIERIARETGARRRGRAAASARSRR